jgi:hypothetical protein
MQNKIEHTFSMGMQTKTRSSEMRDFIKLEKELTGIPTISANNEPDFDSVDFSS